MKGHALTLLALLCSAHAMAQEEAYKGNPHIILPDDKPQTIIPLDQPHKTFPFTDAEVTNLFSIGYSSFGSGEKVIRLAHRKQPARKYFFQIGDFVGSYRLDRLEIDGKQYELVLVNSNATVIIRAHQRKDTHLNRIVLARPDIHPVTDR